MTAPTDVHWTAVLHTLGYVKHTLTQGLFFNNNPSFDHHAY